MVHGMNAGNGKLISDQIGIIEVPDFPDGSDWGLKLIYTGAIKEKRQY